MRLAMALIALLSLGACSWLQSLRSQDTCAETTGSQMRSLDREIAEAERAADGAHHGYLPAPWGGGAPHICRDAGGDTFECAPIAGHNSYAPDIGVEDPHARLAELEIERQAVLRRMMRCQQG